MTTKKAPSILIRTTSNLDELTQLLDGDLDLTCLPKSRPLTPSQVDKLVKKAFNRVLSELHILRLELLQKHSNINALREYSKSIQQRQNSKSKKIIDPRSITVPRSIAVFDKRLQFIEDYFTETLQLYERQTGKAWIPDGELK